MTAPELLSQLREIGVELKTSDGERLVVDAPKGTITPDLRSALTANKVELLRILKKEQIADQLPAATAELAKLPTPAAKVLESVAMMTAPASKDESASATQEIKRLETELMRLRAEEEARRGELVAARLAAENALRVEQEHWHQAEEETARHRAEQEKTWIEAEAHEHAEEENRRRIAEHELARGEEELNRMRAMESARRADVEARQQAAEEAHRVELEALRKSETEQAQRRAEEERRYLEAEGRKKAQEDELRRHAEMRFRAVEEEIVRVQAREDARQKTAAEAQRLAEETARRRVDEEIRRRAEEQARIRAEEESQLRTQIEAEMRAEAAARRAAEEEAHRRAEEEARRRAQEEAERLAAAEAVRHAEIDARREAEEEARHRSAEDARHQADEQARQQAEQQARSQAEEEARRKAEDAVSQRAEMEARIRAEVEAKIRAEEAERRQAESLHRAEEGRVQAEQDQKSIEKVDYPFELERPEVDEPTARAVGSKTSEIVEWFDVGFEPERAARETSASQLLHKDHFASIHEDADGEFHAVSVPETEGLEGSVPTGTLSQLNSQKSGERAAAVADLARFGGEGSFRHITAAFDDQSAEVRSAAARALYEIQDDRAAAFTRALREAAPERRRKIGASIASSGLAGEAIRNLTGESRDKTYDAFSLLFLMSKAGEVQPLMRAIEEHPNIEVRLAVVKLLALSGQPDILPAFRRMAVRGSLPPEVRAAVMEAIYQITSQSPAEAQSMA